MPISDNAPKHLREFIENVQEVELLMQFHSEIAGASRGRKRDVEVLNKSAIVLIVACWEAYVEDVASAALKHMIDHCKDHSIFPTHVLERVGSKHSGINAWKLAGTGWKKALSDNLSEVLAKTTGSLNTPRAEQVDDLFSKTIGFQKISSKWAWTGRSASQAKNALDSLITLRGSIAHRVQHSHSVRKVDVQSSIELVSRLAVKTNNHIGRYIEEKTGQGGWGVFIFNGMK